MTWRAARWLCLGLLACILGGALYLHLATRAVLDSSYSYSVRVAELPRFDGSDGLVLLDFRGYTYRVRVGGFEQNPGAPAIILLHGFPVTSAMWLPVMDALVRAGYRVVAPDQRGYSPGARPVSQDAYRIAELVADVIALADTLELQQFHLVGHDWGAMIGWHVALSAPQRLRSWSALTLTHPAAFADALENDPDQQRRSRYIRLLSLPWLPEALMLRNNLARLRLLGSPDWPEQSSEYVGLFSESGAATAALNWYRALPSELQAGLPVDGTVRVPTLFISGSNDKVLGPYSIAAQRVYMAAGYEVLELNAGHRLVQQKSGQVADALVAHFRRNP